MTNSFNALTRRPASVAFVVFVAITGCTTETTSPGTAPAIPRRAVSGTVTLDGTPLASGTIQFMPPRPVAGTTPSVPAAGRIKDGKFSLTQDDGPSPGKYKVSISSKPPREVTPDQEPSSATRIEPEKVPEKYNRKTTLECEVKDSGENMFPFDLKT